MRNTPTLYLLRGSDLFLIFWLCDCGNWFGIDFCFATLGWHLSAFLGSVLPPYLTHYTLVI